MKKTISVFLLLAMFLVAGVVLAKNDKNIADTEGYVLPEEEGIYNVPGRPELKLRVFVYKEKLSKPGKPTPPAPTQQCGLVDADSNAVVAAAGWKIDRPWEYRLNLGSVPATVGGNNLAVIADNSFRVWTEAASGAVTVSRGADTLVSRAVLDGQNIITWGSTSASALAVSYIWYNQATGVATEVDTIMNKKFTWYWSGSTSCAFGGVYDAQNILTHELGHTFGLNDHYTAEYVNNTMYGYGSKTEVKKNTLTVGDTSGINLIY
jgi:hypothetical protein